jgi:cytochrome c-type biogenesis protein CcmH/NrfG
VGVIPIFVKELSMSNDQLANQLAQAWTFLQSGRGSEAQRAFQGILQNNTNDIDALYGLGLAQRMQKDAAARATFEQCLQNIESLKKNESKSNSDRAQMLERIIKQRLSELGA